MANRRVARHWSMLRPDRCPQFPAIMFPIIRCRPDFSKPQQENLSATHRLPLAFGRTAKLQTCRRRVPPSQRQPRFPRPPSLVGIARSTYSPDRHSLTLPFNHPRTEPDKNSRSLSSATKSKNCSVMRVAQQNATSALNHSAPLEASLLSSQ